jgi:glycosyltransferase involved in cell wall biosynthesis
VTQRLRILHCMRAPVGGLFRHVLDLAGEQAARGHDVGIVADQNASDALTTGKLNQIAPKLTLGLLLTPMSRNPGFGDLSAARTVAAHATPLNPDVIHGHGAKGGAYARLAARLIRGARPKTFYTPHGGTLNFAPGSLEARVYHGIERALLRHTSGIVFESAYAQRVFDERIGLRGVASRVVPNGLQPADFTQHTPNPDAADFLFVGELRMLKGVDVLLSALSTVSTSRPVTAVIVGDGPDAQTFKTLADGLELSNSVTFPGAMPAAKAFPLGRCLVVPSLKESFPYIVLEAGAAAMPMIATNVGGIPEIVAGTNIKLIPPGDVAALAQALNAAVTNRDTADALAQSLKAVVAQKFTAAAMTSSILEFYGEARPN